MNKKLPEVFKMILRIFAELPDKVHFALLSTLFEDISNIYRPLWFSSSLYNSTKQNQLQYFFSISERHVKKVYTSCHDDKYGDMKMRGNFMMLVKLWMISDDMIMALW